MSTSFLQARHPQGRMGTGIAQGETGLDYPLVQPSADIRYLLADFHLAIEAGNYQLPFRIYWMYGFGTGEGDGSSASSSAIEEPVASHDHDIVIVDADDKVVFDSTDDEVYYEVRTWGSRLNIIIWQHPDESIASLVYHTAWGDDEEPAPQEYDETLFPEAAVLDERTVLILPKRLQSLTVVLDKIQHRGVDFEAGYNMQIDAVHGRPINGGRRVNRVTFSASPGGGLGIFPGCDPEPLTIRTINGVQPTVAGDFFLAAGACYWIRQPTKLLSSDPLTTQPHIELLPGSVQEEGLPSELAGTTKDAEGWPTSDSAQYAHLQFGNDCVACCDCPDYVAVANYLNDERNKYHATGVSLEGSRDQYHANRERWLTAADCFNRYPVRVRMLPQICPFLDVAIQFCNQTDDCRTDLVLTVNFSTSPTGATAIEMPGFTFIRGASTQPGRRSPITERYQMGGTWPTFSAVFDSVQPGQSVHARFRLKFNDCGVAPGGGNTPYAVTGCVTATEGGNPVLVTDKDTGGNVAAEACETKTLNCPPPAGSLADYLTCACEEE